MVHQKYDTLLISFCIGGKLKSEPVIRHRMMNILKSGAVTLQLQFAIANTYKHQCLPAIHTYTCKSKTFIELSLCCQQELLKQ